MEAPTNFCNFEYIKKYSKEELTKENFFQAIAKEIEEILVPLQKDFFTKKHNKPTVVLVCGVNGVGKTTTIGKLCKKLKKPRT